MSVLLAFSPLGPVEDVLTALLEWLHSTLGFTWALSIIVLTTIVRFLMVPLTVKQIHSMQKLQAFAPELKALQQKYKHDKQRQQQEVMAFYRENKVNPLASCLPLLAQLPVFLALFYLLQDDLRLDICPDVNPPGTSDPQPCGDGGAASFLFIPDLTDKATGGVLVALESGADKAGLEALGKQLAMHVASANPKSLTIDALDKAEVERERGVLTEKAAQSGKAADIITKMVEGGIRKAYQEWVLLEQAFIIDGKTYSGSREVEEFGKRIDPLLDAS